MLKTVQNAQPKSTWHSNYLLIICTIINHRCRYPIDDKKNQTPISNTFKSLNTLSNKE